MIPLSTTTRTSPSGSTTTESSSHFYLEGVGAGRRVDVFRIDPSTDVRLGLLTSGLTGGGWVDLNERSSSGLVARRTRRTSVPSQPGRRR
jgi:hypothetical protein